MIRTLFRRILGARFAKIENPGTCFVRIGRKSTVLSVDYAPNQDPQYMVYLRNDLAWEKPEKELISEDELQEIHRFLPGEIKRNDGLSISVIFVEEDDSI